MRAILAILLVLSVSGCSTVFPNQDVTGLAFPSVSGESLSQKTVSIPQDFFGKPTLLLVGYVQDSQFDIDRWLIGLDMTQTQVAIYEIPTIAGMFPRMFSTVIDNGMRAGIPKELWGGVVTVYKDGALVQEFTGNVNPNNARVLLLDSAGKVIYFYDRGFAVEPLNKLRAVLAQEITK
ncbi:MAG: hypothetical protein ACPGR2_13775 [Psychrobium sp.]